MSTILHGLPLMTTKPFFLNAEHCIGKVREDPASATSKLCSSSAILFYVCVGGVLVMFETVSATGEREKRPGRKRVHLKQQRREGEMKKNEEKFRKTSQSQRKFNASTPSISLTHSSPTLLLSLSLPLLLLLPQPALLALAIFAIFAIFAARRRRFFSKHVNRSATVAAALGSPSPICVGLSPGRPDTANICFFSVFVNTLAHHAGTACSCSRTRPLHRRRPPLTLLANPLCLFPSAAAG